MEDDAVDLATSQCQLANHEHKYMTGQQ